MKKDLGQIKERSRTDSDSSPSDSEGTPQKRMHQPERAGAVKHTPSYGRYLPHALPCLTGLQGHRFGTCLVADTSSRKKEDFAQLATCPHLQEVTRTAMATGE